ncbi:uncharacterized protein ACNS7B_004146 isoform 1-T1 [Menidia menidia]
MASKFGEADVPTMNENPIGLGRGRFLREFCDTPVRSADNVGSPAFSSTRLPNHPSVLPEPTDRLSAPSHISDPALKNLIAQIAQEVGHAISTQLKGESKADEDRDARTQSSGANQNLSDLTHNLAGMRLVMQAETREPPSFRGDVSDKLSVYEWEELMDTYLRKRGVPHGEQHQEILYKLMGKARDVVKITLRSNPALKPQENPRVMFDILKQHFSETTSSNMPLADFYGTVPHIGENPIEYWLRLNKAIDAAEEALSRQGRHIDDPSREVTMMFVKYCPDPALAAVLRFKAPDKWTAMEIQEHVDRYQIERKAKANHPSLAKRLSSHVQAHEEIISSGSPVSSPVQIEGNVNLGPQLDDNCIKTLISLLDRTLVQNNQTVPRNPSHGQFQRKFCKVCQSTEHSTLAHCRQDRLCLSCFRPGHIKRDCPNKDSRQDPRTTSPLEGQQHLN